MTSINFQFFIENDSNPFILFTNTGKIKYLNNSAEVLMGSCKPKEIFNLALTYAPQTFGVKKSALTLNFNSFLFYGINVLYESDEYIGIHLYNKAIEKIDKQMILDGFSLTDINMLLQANIELFQMNYSGKVSLLTDYHIPEFQMHQNNFSLLLRNLFIQSNESKILKISVKIKLGEQVFIKNKKYAIIVLELTSSNRNNKMDKELKVLAQKNCIDINLQKESVTLEIPAIK
ncbi:MAG: Unknown protein [uncultured Sulfurovum sp.]|uniref:PAS domain-containing protein n=1 Tax=uncultured Sulfurovum sp. TaxID=269237 RepID=A0A6S6U9R7_9BACT|nr:MAG: Unknown protein [uncultured Sulfurovum sp.]